jgi:[ribosomal protein S18]-alanine N-acetyltransferase
MIAKIEELIEIKEMTLSDLNDVYNLEIKAYEYPWEKNILRGCVINKYDCFIATIDKQIVGYLITKISSPESHILNLTIDKNYRNNGIASQFLEMVILKCRLLKSNIIFLETRLSNLPAISLYIKFGFKKIGLRRNYYKSRNGRENAVIFSMSIT